MIHAFTIPSLIVIYLLDHWAALDLKQLMLKTKAEHARSVNGSEIRAHEAEYELPVNGMSGPNKLSGLKTPISRKIS